MFRQFSQVYDMCDMGVLLAENPEVNGPMAVDPAGQMILNVRTDLESSANISTYVIT